MQTDKRKHHDDAQSPEEYLRGIFLERKSRNPMYSTRAFARDLGFSQTLLSLILNGKRPLSVKQAARIGILLNLPQDESQRLLDSTLNALPKKAKGKKLGKTLFKDYDVERFKAISQWYHVAILDLTTTKNFKNNPKWIADRLGISPIEARDAVNRWIGLGFLEDANGTLQKVDSKIYFATQRSEPAIRNFHKQMMTKAIAKLDETSDVAFEKREISAMTMAVRSDRIKEAKKRIQKFKKEIAGFLTEGDCDEVFQLNIQMFPLTKTTQGDRK